MADIIIRRCNYSFFFSSSITFNKSSTDIAEIDLLLLGDDFLIISSISDDELFLGVYERATVEVCFLRGSVLETSAVEIITVLSLSSLSAGVLTEFLSDSAVLLSISSLRASAVGAVED